MFPFHRLIPALKAAQTLVGLIYHSKQYRLDLGIPASDVWLMIYSWISTTISVSFMNFLNHSSYVFHRTYKNQYASYYRLYPPRSSCFNCENNLLANIAIHRDASPVAVPADAHQFLSHLNPDTKLDGNSLQIRSNSWPTTIVAVTCQGFVWSAFLIQLPASSTYTPLDNFCVSVIVWLYRI